MLTRVGFSLLSFPTLDWPYEKPLPTHIHISSSRWTGRWYLGYHKTWLSSLCKGSSHFFQCSGSDLNYLGAPGAFYFPGTFSSAGLKARHIALLASVLLASTKKLYLINQFVLHPFFLQPPLPTTPTPVPRDPGRKPISMSPCGEATGSPSPPPRTSIPAPSPCAPALSPIRVSAFLL